MSGFANREEIVRYLCAATGEVFGTMLGTSLSAGVARTESAAPGPTEGVVSLVGLAGPLVGTGALSCSAETACKLAGQFLMSEYSSVNEEVLDAVAELTNMIIGGFKTALEEVVGPMGLSIPTVIFGRNFTTRTLSKSEWMVIPFTSELGLFDVHLCLVPNKNGARK